MAELNMFYCRILYLLPIVIIANVNIITGQGNCLIYAEESGERLACELSYRATAYRQGSKESQLLFDKAIELGPKYAWAYYEKSVPFFKRGLFAEGVTLINKAIELEPQNYLYYRAYWYFYNRSNKYCILDLEELYTTHKSGYTTTPGGELEMRWLLAMAHAQSGKVQKGIDWALDLMADYEKQPHLKGFYDHFCLGLLYYLNDQMDLAEIEFEKQLMVNDGLADTYFYLGLIKKRTGDHTLAEAYFKKALARMNGEHGGFSPNLFKAFNTSMEDVEREIFN